MSSKTTIITVSALAALSCATPVGSALAQPMRGAAGGYELTVLVDGAPAQTYYHGGESYVLGQLGARYTLRVSNHTGRRMEAVVSIDGRDAIDGRPADYRNKRGYLIPPWGSVDIEGWRISRAQAAAFRFSSVPDSYAARTGSARDVGVIGVAVFPERHVPRPVYRPRPHEVRPRRTRGTTTIDANASTSAEATRASRALRLRAAARRRTLRLHPRRARQRSRPARRTAKRSRAARAAAAAPAWAPNTARRSTRASTRSTSCARTRAIQSAVLGVRYNDCGGLLAMGIPVDSYYDQACYSHDGHDGYDDGDLRRTAEPFPVTDRRYSPPPPPGWRRPCGWR